MASTLSSPAHDGETLDGLAWRNGFSPEHLPAIAALNPGIVDTICLAAGTTINLPDGMETQNAGTSGRAPARIALWD